MSYKLTQQQIEIVVQHGAQALVDYCQQWKIHYVIVGSSGGLDSAVILGFAQRACQKAAEKDFSLTSVGLIMPCHSSPKDKRLGEEAIRVFGAEEIYVKLDHIYDFIKKNLFDQINIDIEDILLRGSTKTSKDWSWSKKIAQGNIKARLRMIVAYHVARMLKGMVLSTDNLSEFWMSFWTLHGDVGDFSIVQNILKGLELYDVARYLKVPQEIIDRKPSDGLGITGTDEEQLGASYPVLDQVMTHLVQQDFNPEGSLDQLHNLPIVPGASEEVVCSLAKRCLCGSFKRKVPIILSREDLGLLSIKEIELEG